jgi:hypothetical protein
LSVTALGACCTLLHDDGFVLTYAS